MSGLSGLFSMGSGGGASMDLGDALKYSAPKEPKRKASIKIEAEQKPAAAPVPAPTKAAAPVAQSAPQPSKPLGPSKVMASAAVRLFKINQSSRAYEPVDNGSMLGCAILGTGLNFQILVYNAQKVPQAAVTISSVFDYTVRDLYVSFADPSGNFWSLLFDNIENMTNVLKVISAIIFHLNTHNETTLESLRRLLPRNPEVAVDETMLAAGMTAGIYIDVFEIGEPADYPGDVLLSPLRRVQSPDDVLKIKVGSSDVVAGLGDALVGLTKGDRCMIGISPRLFYQPTSNEWIGMAERKFPTNWIVLMIEVVKLKSSDSKEKKKEKKAKEEDVTPVKAAPAPAPAPAPPAPFDPAPPADSTPDIKSRMARVAAAGGASHQLGDILGGRKTMQAAPVAAATPVASVAPTAPVVHIEEPSTALVVVAAAVAPATPVAAAQPAAATPVQIQPQPAQVRGPAATPGPMAAASAPAAATSYRPQDSIMAQKEAMLQQSQDSINQQLNATGSSPAYAVAVAAESSSMLMTDGGLRDRNLTMLIENNQQSQQQYFTQFQQSMMIIQQSMMQMTTKLDQVGMSVNNTFALVQQQASAVAVSNNGSNGMNNMGMNNMGMNNMGGMGMNNMGMNMMGMNPMAMGMGGMNPMGMGMGGMNPMMMQQMGYGSNASSFYGNNGGGGGMMANPVRGKVDELVTTAQFIAQQYEQVKRENEELQQKGGSGQQEAQQLQEQLVQLRATVADFESQRSQWQKEKEQLNSQLDGLRRDKTALEADLAAAKSTVNLDAPAVQSFVQTKLAEQEKSFGEKIKEQQTQLEQAQQKSVSKVSSLEGEVNTLKNELENVRAQADREIAAAREAAAAASTSSSSTDDGSATQALKERIASLEQEVTSLSTQLNGSNEEVQSLRVSLEAAKAEAAPSSNGQDEAKIQALEEQIRQLQETNQNAGRFSEDDFKTCMQDVFIQAGSAFITQDELASIDDESKRETMAQVTKVNLKRLKEILRQITVSRLS